MPDIGHLTPIGVVESDAFDGIIGPSQLTGVNRRLETGKQFDVRLLQLRLISTAGFLHLKIKRKW